MSSARAQLRRECVCGHERWEHQGEVRVCRRLSCSCATYSCENCARTPRHQLTVLDAADSINCALCGTTLRVIDG